MRLTWPARGSRQLSARGAVPAVWQQDVPHLLGSLWVADGRRGGFVPVLVLAEHTAPDLPLTPTDWLVRHGWSYVEPPVRLAALPVLPDGRRRCRGGPLYLTPCEGADVLWPGHASPASAEDEWWRRVTASGRRVVVLIAQNLDLVSAGMPDDRLLNSTAIAGHVVGTTARLSAVRPGGRWQFDAVGA